LQSFGYVPDTWNDWQAPLQVITALIRPFLEQVQIVGGFMRLVCPNCAAQYEVDASAIPDDGRDVQCANCGNTWFQPPEAVEAEALSAPSIDHEEMVEDEPAQDPPLTRPPATPVDQSVLDILRQEAELDATTRQSDPEEPVLEEAEAETELEDEPEPDSEPAELSLAERAAQNRLSARRETSARISLSPPSESEDQFETDTASIAEDDTASEYNFAPQHEAKVERAERAMPDVDALNSTLRPANDKGRAREEKRERKKSKDNRGSNRGFYFAILIFLVLLAAYALRPQIIDAVPASEPYLIQYAVLVDTARIQVETGMLALIEAVKNLIARFV
jgi:predicted Zn finger-like uncharacterized protein